MEYEDYEYSAQSIRQGFGLPAGLWYSEWVSLAAEEQGNIPLARYYARIAAHLAAELQEEEETR